MLGQDVDNHLGGVYGRFREHPTPRLRRGDYRGRPSPRLRRGDYRRREKAALGRCFGRVAGAVGVPHREAVPNAAQRRPAASREA